MSDEGVAEAKIQQGGLRMTQKLAELSELPLGESRLLGDAAKSNEQSF